MPTNLSQLRSLLGGLSYYRKCLPNLSKRIRPITDLSKKNVPFIFTKEMEAIVRDLLKILTDNRFSVFRTGMRYKTGHVFFNCTPMLARTVSARF